MNDKIKQVQVRLTPELHLKLKTELVSSQKSLVDFFNEAAEAYLKDKNAYEKSIYDIIGGNKNGGND